MVATVLTDNAVIAIIGNCQARPLHLVFKYALPNSTLLEPIIVHLAKLDHEDKIYSLLNRADIIITQLISGFISCPVY